MFADSAPWVPGGGTCTEVLHRPGGAAPAAARGPGAGGAGQCRRPAGHLGAAARRPAVQRLVEQFRAGQPAVRALWATYDVAVRHADRKRILHPEAGLLELDCEVLLDALEHDQRLILHTAAPGTETAEKLERCGSSAWQQLALRPPADAGWDRRRRRLYGSMVVTPARPGGGLAAVDDQAEHVGAVVMADRVEQALAARGVQVELGVEDALLADQGPQTVPVGSTITE